MEHALSLRLKGLIPGPLETESLFQARVLRALGRPCPDSHLLAPYQVRAPWVPVEHNSPELRFFEGGATLIDQEEDRPIECRILLGNRSFFIKSEAILAHELVHAIRCGFPDSAWEEALAWATCPSKVLRGLSWLVLDMTQLLLSGCGILAMLWAWTLSLPWLLPIGLVSLGIAGYRAWTVAYPLRRSLKALSRASLPTWPLLLHLLPEEIVLIAREGVPGLHKLLQGSDFRTAFLVEAFPQLREEFE